MFNAFVFPLSFSSSVNHKRNSSFFFFLSYFLSRNIAKVVSQVHAFQENPYTFTPDYKLQSYLRQRITRFKDADISALAADNCANFHHIPAEKHSRKIQDTLRRMKATFQ